MINEKGGDAQDQSKKIPLSDRATLSPTEFAALFGRHYTWGYRQIYAGKVKVVTDLGRMMIPRSEVDRLVSNPQVYSGKR